MQNQGALAKRQPVRTLTDGPVADLLWPSGGGGATTIRSQDPSGLAAYAEVMLLASEVVRALVSAEDSPTPSPSSSDVAGTAVRDAVNIASLVLVIVAGVIVGIIVALVVSLTLRAVFRRSRIASAVLNRTRGPSFWAFMAWGAYVGMRIKFVDRLDPDTVTNAGLVTTVGNIVLLLAIGATTWVLYAAAWIVEDAARLRHEADDGRSRRFETQAQVLRRVLQVIIVLLGIAWALYIVFPGAQRAMSTVLASAGVLSVVAGLAAQATLGNLFAGIQLAFTDAIRVGDVVVVGGSTPQQGSVEEITLTYVVVRLWDERRLIMPSTEFASKPFENWTRRAARQLGTVELELDWGAPMAEVRERVEHLLLATDLWDGRTWNVQMTESTRDSATIRIVVSAKDSGTLWDLRCYLRENLVSWLASEGSWARPATRIQPLESVTVTHDESRELVAKLATELSDIAGPDTSGGGGKTANAAEAGVAQNSEDAPEDAIPDALPGSPVDAFHAARMKAARRKAKRARRRAMADRMHDGVGLGSGTGLSDADPTRAPSANGTATAVPATTPEAQRTRVFTSAELNEISERYQAAARGDATTAAGAGEDVPTTETTELLVVSQDARAGSAQPASADVASTGPSSSASPSPSSAAGVPEVSPSAVEILAEVTHTASLPVVPAFDADAVGASSSALTNAATTTTSGGKGERLYSGSPEAEERSQIFKGPGEDVIAEREETAKKRAEQSQALSGVAAPPDPQSSSASSTTAPSTTESDDAASGTAGSEDFAATAQASVAGDATDPEGDDHFAPTA